MKNAMPKDSGQSLILKMLNASPSIAIAAANGVPCVVTEVGDSGSIVGETGKVVPPSDPDALGQAILSLAAKLYDGRKQQSSRRIVDLYSVRSMVDRTIAAVA